MKIQVLAHFNSILALETALRSAFGGFAANATAVLSSSHGRREVRAQSNLLDDC